MKVWLLMYDVGDEYSPLFTYTLAIFRTKERAEEELAKYRAAEQNSSQYYYYIEEWNVNE